MLTGLTAIIYHNSKRFVEESNPEDILCLYSVINLVISRAEIVSTMPC